MRWIYYYMTVYINFKDFSKMTLFNKCTLKNSESIKRNNDRGSSRLPQRDQIFKTNWHLLEIWISCIFNGVHIRKCSLNNYALIYLLLLELHNLFKIWNAIVVTDVKKTSIKAIFPEFIKYETLQTIPSWIWFNLRIPVHYAITLIAVIDGVQFIY